MTNILIVIFSAVNPCISVLLMLWKKEKCSLSWQE